MSNFKFLNRVNENLFIIAQEAEKLFRDGYFEQSITQTRRLAEHLCRDVMVDKAKSTDTFDDMLATLKDTPAQNDFEKEFLDDLYFLKKAGNNSVHSLTVKQDGNAALECLQRAFEASINYAVFKKGADSKLLHQLFDEKLLATGKKGTKNKKYMVKEKYEKLEAKERKNKIFKPEKKAKKKEKDFDDYEKSDEKSFFKKSIWKEILETIIAGLVIALVYFFCF